MGIKGGLYLPKNIANNSPEQSGIIAILPIDPD